MPNSSDDVLNEILARVTQIQRMLEGAYVPGDIATIRGNTDWPATPMPTMSEMKKLVLNPTAYVPAGMRDISHP